MRLAHLILAHNNPLQLERLVRRLSHPDADIYIQLDNKTAIAPYIHIGDITNTFFIKKRINVIWGEYSIIQATLLALEEIQEKGNTYTHINLLSGVDYPLQPADKIHRFLFSNTGKTFMWYDKIFDDWVHGQVRMSNYYLGEYGFPGRYQLAALMNKMLPKRKLPNGLIAYGRSQWLTITPESVAYIIRFIKDNPAVERFFKMTWAVDEVFFQTILCNSHLQDTLVNDNLRYLILQPDFRPVTYTMNDAQALLSSGKFYARKFDLNAGSAIFNYLDSKSAF